MASKHMTEAQREREHAKLKSEIANEDHHQRSSRRHKAMPLIFHTPPRGSVGGSAMDSDNDNDVDTGGMDTGGDE